MKFQRKVIYYNLNHFFTENIWFIPNKVICEEFDCTISSTAEVRRILVIKDDNALWDTTCRD